MKEEEESGYLSLRECQFLRKKLFVSYMPSLCRTRFYSNWFKLKQSWNISTIAKYDSVNRKLWGKSRYYNLDDIKARKMAPIFSWGYES